MVTVYARLDDALLSDLRVGARVKYTGADVRFGFSPTEVEILAVGTYEAYDEEHGSLPVRIKDIQTGRVRWVTVLS